MDTTDFVLLTLLAMGGEMRGKTKLQKTVYFTGLITDHLNHLGFRAHFYGPYSDEVTEATHRLKAFGVLEETVAGGSAFDRAGFEVCRHDFRLSVAGREYAEDIAKRHGELWEQVSSATKILKEAGDPDYMLLSVAAKTYFMLGQRKGRASEAELVALAPRFGWNVTAEQIGAAAQYLGKLGLVESCQNCQ